MCSFLGKETDTNVLQEIRLPFLSIIYKNVVEDKKTLLTFVSGDSRTCFFFISLSKSLPTEGCRILVQMCRYSYFTLITRNLCRNQKRKEPFLRRDKVLRWQPTSPLFTRTLNHSKPHVLTREPVPRLRLVCRQSGLQSERFMRSGVLPCSRGVSDGPHGPMPNRTPCAHGPIPYEIHIAEVLRRR